MTITATLEGPRGFAIREGETAKFRVTIAAPEGSSLSYAVGTRTRGATADPEDLGSSLNSSQGMLLMGSGSGRPEGFWQPIEISVAPDRVKEADEFFYLDVHVTGRSGLDERILFANGESHASFRIEILEGPPADLEPDPRPFPQGLWIEGSDLTEDLAGRELGDTISGSGGRDRIEGGRGDDSLWGGDGDDRLLGGSGRDEMHGGRGDDTLRGGSDDDRMEGSSGADRLEGGSGDDRPRGGSGDDALRGEKGHDRLAGQSGDDTLRGGTGHDRLDGGAGDDWLHGGKGRDVFLFAQGRDVALDFDPGEDRLVIDTALLEEGTTVEEVLRLHGSRKGDHLMLDFGEHRLTIRDGWEHRRSQEMEEAIRLRLLSEDPFPDSQPSDTGIDL